MTPFSATPLALALTLLTLLAGCASNVALVEPPSRNADLFPGAQRSSGLVVAVDAITEPRRIEKYFGVPLQELGIVPVMLIVSNYGDAAVSVTPADALVLKQQSVIDPVPAAHVTQLVHEHFGADGETANQISAHFERMAFAEQVAAPGETVDGLLFFDVGVEKRRESDFFTLVSLYPRSRLKLKLAVTEVENRQRLHFGPFPLDR